MSKPVGCGGVRGVSVGVPVRVHVCAHVLFYVCARLQLLFTYVSISISNAYVQLLHLSLSPINA